MAPGGEMYRLYERFGENVPRNGRHECLPYSRNAVCAQIANHQLPVWFGACWNNPGAGSPEEKEK